MFHERGRPVDEHLRCWLLALAIEYGTARAARRVGLSPGAFTKAAAGLNVSAGTEAIAELAHQRADVVERNVA
jgi:hypothetical protein